MAATSTRTLRLLSLLQTHKYWPGDELADRLGVSARTLRRDVERLRDLGYPVEAQRGVDGGYQLAPGAALPPLMIDDDEAVALVVGMQAAVHGGVDGIGESAVRVLAKVIHVLPPRLRKRVDALRAMTVPAAWGPAGQQPLDPVVLTTLALACRDSERLRFGYTAADAAEFVRAGVEQAPRPYAIEVVVRAPEDQVRERIGRWSVVEAIDAHSCRVRMSADSLEWPIMGLGMLDADFTVVRPEILRER